MVVSGGSSTSYYKCSGYKKRGTCPNRISVLEDRVCSKILRTVRKSLSSPRNIVELRRMVTERPRNLSQSQDSDLRQAQTRLEVTETKIGHLMEAVTEGLNSPSVAQSLKDIEARAATDKATIERLRTLPSLATVLPHPR
jgi:site-specific DNA recombinase